MKLDEVLGCVETGAEDECWPWMGAVTGHGYGHAVIHGRDRTAHRVAYELRHRPIPEGLLACHSCDNPLCANPKHIWIGTHKQNTQDMMRKGRQRNGDVSRHGTANPNAKLTEVDVRYIRRSRRRSRDLARHYGVARNHIGAIRAGRVWKHVQ